MKVGFFGLILSVVWCHSCEIQLSFDRLFPESSFEQAYKICAHLATRLPIHAQPDMSILIDELSRLTDFLQNITLTRDDAFTLAQLVEYIAQVWYPIIQGAGAAPTACFNALVTTARQQIWQSVVPADINS